MSYYSPYNEPAMGFGVPRITWAVHRLMLVTGGIFILQLLLEIPFGTLPGPPPGGFVTEWLAFSPGKLFLGHVYAPFTYMFLHAGLMHLFMNMLWLFFFGPEVERTLGTRGFYSFYLFCGAVGVLATVLPFVIFNRDVSVTGASGAVMGVLIAFAMIDPERQFHLFPLPMPINARALVIIVVAINILNAIASQGADRSVSVETHFGGMIAGAAYMKLLPFWNRYSRRWTGWRWPGRSANTTRLRPKPKPGPGSDRNDKLDKVGEAVDNIFKFKDHEKKPWD